MTEKTEIDDDCGCNSQSSQEHNEREFEKIKDSMESTRENLNSMFDKIKDMNLDFSRFSNLEKDVREMTQYMRSGDFLKSMEGVLEKANVDTSVLSKMNTINPQVYSPFKQKEKQPIGYVWIDESGEQKFSPEKPDDIVSMPVYGE
jgi:vacuolar-type H+-ATPase subunit I/STV1